MEQRGEMETEMGAGKEISDWGQKKEKKVRKWWTDLRVKWSEIAGKQGRALPVGFSALYPLCVQSNLYTRTSMCNWKTDCSEKWWRQNKKCKEFWEQRGREEHSQGRAAMDICRETFPVCSVVCRSICAATPRYTTHLLALIDKQKHEVAIWGELCNLRNVLIIVPSSLNPDLAFTKQISLRGKCAWCNVYWLCDKSESHCCHPPLV